jgi:hypothetical protein
LSFCFLLLGAMLPVVPIEADVAGNVAVH